MSPRIYQLGRPFSVDALPPNRRLEIPARLEFTCTGYRLRGIPTVVKPRDDDQATNQERDVKAISIDCRYNPPQCCGLPAHALVHTKSWRRSAKAEWAKSIAQPT